MSVGLSRPSDRHGLIYREMYCAGSARGAGGGADRAGGRDRCGLIVHVFGPYDVRLVVILSLFPHEIQYMDERGRGPWKRGRWDSGLLYCSLISVACQVVSRVDDGPQSAR